MTARLLRHVVSHRGLALGALGAMLATTAFELLLPWPLKVVVDHAIAQRPLAGRVPEGDLRLFLLVAAAVAYVLVASLRGVSQYLRQRWTAEVSQLSIRDMRSELYAQLQRLSLRFHDRARVGDLVTRLTADVDKLQDAFVDAATILLADLLVVVGAAVVMFAIDARFALISLIVVPPLALIYATFRSRIKEASRAVRSSEGAVASLAQEVLSSMRVVRAFGQETREQARFRREAQGVLDASIEAATWEGMFAFAVEVVTAIGLALVIGYGGWRVLRGELSVGDVLVFFQYLRTLYDPVRRLSKLSTILQRAGASAERLDDIFGAAPDVPEHPHPRPLPATSGRITFDAVHFSYEPAVPVLRGVDLEVASGEALALVGVTGSGKSTLASLVPRFYDPTRGRVLLDDHDLREIRVSDLRDRVAVVLQDALLLSGTVRENIAYARPGASDAAIEAAARAAHAAEFIARLPDGYETPIAERGVTLSGGQRQRIAVARALLKDAPILILDEPTSAVDPESEALIVDALQRLRHGRTVLIISHRPSLAGMADRIAVLEDGRIAELGTSAELRDRGGRFARIYAVPATG